MDDKAKDKARQIIKVEAMSSEESYSSPSEDDHEFKRKFIRLPLDWRSKEADELLTSRSEARKKTKCGSKGNNKIFESDRKPFGKTHAGGHSARMGC